MRSPTYLVSVLTVKCLALNRRLLNISYCYHPPVSLKLISITGQEATRDGQLQPRHGGTGEGSMVCGGSMQGS